MIVVQRCITVVSCFTHLPWFIPNTSSKRLRCSEVGLSQVVAESSSEARKRSPIENEGNWEAMEKTRKIKGLEAIDVFYCSFFFYDSDSDAKMHAFEAAHCSCLHGLFGSRDLP